jgi:methylmalonyl-CoA decarboxylase
MSFILTEHTNSVGTITLNHMERRNALSGALVQDLIDGFDVMEQAKTRVVILRAEAGAKVWSAGHDVKELPRGGRDPLGWADPLRMLIRRIEDFPAPVIALVEGSVWGGACELALSCDILITAPEVTLAITPAKLSVPYNVTGLLTFMNRMPFSLLSEMAFAGEPISATRAHALGVINHLVPAGELTEFAQKFAARVAKNAPLSVTAMKRSMNILGAAKALPPIIFEQIQGERRKVWDSDDYKEGIAAFLERREPHYRGS